MQNSNLGMRSVLVVPEHFHTFASASSCLFLLHFSLILRLTTDLTTRLTNNGLGDCNVTFAVPVRTYLLDTRRRVKVDCRAHLND